MTTTFWDIAIIIGTITIILTGIKIGLYAITIINRILTRTNNGKTK